jgi:predicted Zn-dependent protease
MHTPEAEYGPPASANVLGVTYQRFVAIALIVLLMCASIPAPLRAATSTATEVELGKEADKSILAQTNVVGDLLLNAWVAGISQPLFAATARKDVPYSIKILDAPDVNAFSTLGGFVYVDAGLLDFAQSDDELAGVIGHETGHIERRHALQTENKAGILNLLFGIGSMFSPFLYRFGQIFEAGAIAKIEREDEYQADKYGLMLMTRTGYDPDAMVSFMGHLGAYAGEHNSLIDKYLADHPETPKRIGALVGYPELDPKVRTNAQRLAAAIHDQDEARYAIAARQFATIVKADPGNTVAQYHLGEAQLALGATAPGEQNLTLAAQNGSAETRSLAFAQITALRASEKRFNLARPDLQPLRDQLAAAQLTQTQAAAAILTRRDSGRDQLKQLESREETIAYGLPNLAQINARTGTRLDAILRNIATMGRALDTTNAKAQFTLSGVGSLLRNRDGGLLKRNAELLGDMNAKLRADPLTPQVLSTLPEFPRMLGDLSAADADMVRAVDASRASLAILDLGLGDLDLFIRNLQTVRFFRGDVIESDYKALEPLMTRAVDSLNRAAVVASQGTQLFDMARAGQTEAAIDLQGLAMTPERYATLQHALDVRFKNGTIDYATMIGGDLSPGQVVAASIIAADITSTPQAIVAEAASSRRSMIEVANGHGVPALSLEIFMNLILLDYVDDPEKETRVLT